MYIERHVMRFWRQLYVHSQVSWESIAICYNSSYKTKNEFVSKLFDTCSENKDEEMEEEEPEIGNYFINTTNKPFSVVSPISK